ncbi:MAG: magnesium/cobalt transporter CorA [Planctomycetes bacterium]|nr:magnesium/cobalt transporter CorA [Planctomycetota bacterium]
MVKFFKKTAKNLGLPPGTISESTQTTPPAVISLMDYDSKDLQEKEIKNIAGSFPFKDSPKVTWINIEGIDPKAIQKIDEHFGIHPLVSEDIVNGGQRPKLEDFGDYIFIALKMISFNEESNEIIDEQVSLILGSNFVISIQKNSGALFEPIRQRIRENKGRVRTMGADYLAYVLLDTIVDNYYLVIEKRGEEIEGLEEDVILNPCSGIGQELHHLKRDMIYLRRQIWPLREVISGMQRNESKLIKKQTTVYLRDVYDHTIQVIDTIESFRDIISGIHDSYLSGISNKMNEVMKVLTIFAAIFIPLTFMAGIYGMNFEFMPELKWRYGYFIALGLMGAVGVGMLAYFRKKKWI